MAVPRLGVATVTSGTTPQVGEAEEETEEEEEEGMRGPTTRLLRVALLLGRTIATAGAEQKEQKDGEQEEDNGRE